MNDQNASSVPPQSRAGTLPYQHMIKTVSVEDTFGWLAAGWRDFRAAGFVSVGYGLFFVAVGLALTIGLYLAGYEYLIAPTIEAFLLIGPALTVGLHGISRSLEQGEKPTLAAAFTAWRRNPVPLIGFGLALLGFLIVWLRLAVVIFAVSFPYTAMNLRTMAETILFSTDGYIFLALGTAVGCFLATLVFMGSVASLPLMMDQKASFLKGVVVSFIAVALNFRAMMVWAVIIVTVTGIGLATAYVGLAITLPLIGHASWHAYRALIEPDNVEAAT